MHYPPFFFGRELPGTPGPRAPPKITIKVHISKPLYRSPGRRITRPYRPINQADRTEKGNTRTRASSPDLSGATAPQGDTFTVPLRGGVQSTTSAVIRAIRRNQASSCEPLPSDPVGVGAAGEHGCHPTAPESARGDTRTRDYQRNRTDTAEAYLLPDTKRVFRVVTRL